MGEKEEELSVVTTQSRTFSFHHQRAKLRLSNIIHTTSRRHGTTRHTTTHTSSLLFLLSRYVAVLAVFLIAVSPMLTYSYDDIACGKKGQMLWIFVCSDFKPGILLDFGKLMSGIVWFK